jgi:hypothetical protein
MKKNFYNVPLYVILLFSMLLRNARLNFICFELLHPEYAEYCRPCDGCQCTGVTERIRISCSVFLVQ